MLTVAGLNAFQTIVSQMFVAMKREILQSKARKLLYDKKCELSGFVRRLEEPFSRHTIHRNRNLSKFSTKEVKFFLKTTLSRNLS